jgi:hypothetical protein
MPENEAVALQPLETRVIPIIARRYNNHTKILLEAGATYDLVATGTWYDASIDCGPEGHDHEKLRRVRFLRRWRAQKWFALIGVVAGKRFLIGSHARITAETTGELICFANDAPITYWNNCGQVDLQITRLS